MSPYVLFVQCSFLSHGIPRRHGESTWNNENRFTGWKDVPLSDKGKEEAAQCGDLIAESGLTFDVAYTSVLKVQQQGVVFHFDASLKFGEPAPAELLYISGLKTLTRKESVRSYVRM